MNYLRAMGTRAINKLIGGFVLFLAAACDPAYQFCDDIGTSARIPDIFILEPFQDTYNRGDVVTLKGSIANISPFFAEPNVNLMETTGVQNALLISNDALYEGNGLEFIKGSQGRNSNWFNMPYNPDTDRYEFEVNITLNKTGSYNFITAEMIDVNGGKCNLYRIDTNIAGANAEGKIVFEVVE